MIFKGIRTGIAEKPYIFVIFKGEGCPNQDQPMNNSHYAMVAQTSAIIIECISQM